MLGYTRIPLLTAVMLGIIPPTFGAPQWSLSPALERPQASAPQALNQAPNVLSPQAVPTPPDVPAVLLDGSAIQLDGRLEEAVWQQAAYITGTTRLEPLEGGPGVGRAEFRVFYDRQALYIGARIYQPLGILRAHILPRDDLGNDDNVVLYLKTFPSSDSAYVIKVNPLGIQRDVVVVQNGNVSIPWDGVWDSVGQPLSDGYSVEVRLPFRTLRFPRGRVLDWAFALGVETGSMGQFDFWPAVSSDRGSPLNQLAVLRGIEGVRPRHDLDLTPSISSRYGGQENERGSFEWNEAKAVQLRQPGIMDPGLDLRYALSPGSSINLALNPDFSQVEADTDQLDYNLRYPLTLPEKRPFFLEGLDIFETPASMLYTRNVNDIVAGLKFTGRSGGLIGGLLIAWDQDPAPSRLQTDPGTDQADISGFEDMTGKDALTTAGRVALDLFSGFRIGAFVADKQAIDRSTGRSIAQNDFASLDCLINISKVYYLTGQVGWSRSAVDGEAPAFGDFYLLNARREDRQFLLLIETSYYSSRLRAETSAISRVNNLPSKASAAYKLEVNRPGLLYMRPQLTVNIVNDPATLALFDWSADASVKAQVAAGASVSGGYVFGQEMFNGSAFPVTLLYSQLAMAPASWLSANMSLTGGRRINYDMDDDFFGTTFDGVFNLTLRPTMLAQLDLSYTKGLFWRPGDKGIQDNVNILWSKVTYNFNSRWSIRAISQLNTHKQSIKNSALISYLYRPGTAVYLGLHDSEPLTHDSPVLAERGLFIKFSYGLQL